MHVTTPHTLLYLHISEILNSLYTAGEPAARHIITSGIINLYSQGKNLCTYSHLPRTLKRATISLRESWSWSRWRRVNSILRAVPTPATCTLPHSLHLSHPTQSIIRDMFLKWPRNSSYSGRQWHRERRVHHLTLSCFEELLVNIWLSLNRLWQLLATQ